MQCILIKKGNEQTFSITYMNNMHEMCQHVHHETLPSYSNLDPSGLTPPPNKGGQKGGQRSYQQKIKVVVINILMNFMISDLAYRIFDIDMLFCILFTFHPKVASYQIDLYKYSASCCYPTWLSLNKLVDLYYNLLVSYLTIIK